MNRRRSGFPAGFCGVAKLAPRLPEIRGHCIVDCHMHIQSNKCAPKPLQDNQLKRLQVLKTAPHLGLVLGGIFLGGKTETEIGKIAVSENQKTYARTTESTEFGYKQNTIFSADATRTDVPTQKKENVFTIMIAQMMDMEYAHLAGYEGQKIYHEENGEAFYYKRQSGTHPEYIGVKKRDEKGAGSLRTWINQFKTTRESILSNPWQLMVMHKYEPRRWRSRSGVVPDIFHNSGAWNFPFKEVATSTKPGIFCGFKIYPPLGFQPCDPHLPHLWKYSTSKSECFLGKCELEKIPILSHCSPGGMTTHEIMFYREFFTRHPNKFSAAGSSSPNPVNAPDATTYRQDIDNTKDAEQWFYDNFVHPSAWRKVLEKFPALRLCLAHFGGNLWKTKGTQAEWIQEIISLITEKDRKGAYKYPNVYTDVACWDITIPSVREALKNTIRSTPELKKRILFGSDWHMIKIVSPFCDYDEYCENWKHYLDDIDEKLWVRFSLVNPFEFYGFSDEAKLRNINEGLVRAKAEPVQRLKGLNRILEIQKEVENLKKALEKWDAEGH